MTTTVDERRTAPWNPDLEQRCVGRPADAALVDWFCTGLEAHISALGTADDGLVCFAPLPADTATALWCRRQLHANTAHRADLANTAASGENAEHVVASDGIDEPLCAFIVRRRTGLLGDEAGSFRIIATDTGHTWTINSNPDGVTTHRDDPGQPALDRIAGNADAIYRALWNRAEVDELDDAGSGRFLGTWSATLVVRFG